MADKVLVTVSIGVLQSDSITFIPPLSQERKNIDAVRFPRGFKIDDEIFGENFIQTLFLVGLLMAKKHIMIWHFKMQFNVLGLLVTRQTTEEYYELGSNDQMVSSVLEELDTIFDGKASATYMDHYLLKKLGQLMDSRWVHGPMLLWIEILIWISSINLCKIKCILEKYSVDKQLGVPGAILSGFNAIEYMMKMWINGVNYCLLRILFRLFK